MSLKESRTRLVFFVGNFRYFLSHRLLLAQEAAAQGYDVWVMVPGSGPPQLLPGSVNVFFLKGFKRTALSLGSLWKDRKSIVSAFKQLKPDLLHNVAMKPIFLGSAFVNSTCGIINDFGGLGYTFIRSSTLYGSKREKFKKFILKLVFYCFLPIVIGRKSCVVLCQNRHDKAILTSCLGGKTPVYSIAGSGLDIDSFCLLPMPPGPPWRLLFAARLLKEKGLEELVEARKLLPKEELEIWVCGDVDTENPSSFTPDEIMAWQKAGFIRWFGFQKNLRPIYAQVHGAVLPSYREGLPRTLLEACAWGRPVITTHAPGCEDVVVDGITGYLAQTQDPKDLSRIIQVWMHDEQKESKGRAARLYISEHFSKEKIHPQLFNLYRALKYTPGSASSTMFEEMDET